MLQLLLQTTKVTICMTIVSTTDFVHLPLLPLQAIWTRQPSPLSSRTWNPSDSKRETLSLWTILVALTRMESWQQIWRISLDQKPQNPEIMSGHVSTTIRCMKQCSIVRRRNNIFSYWSFTFFYMWWYKMKKQKSIIKIFHEQWMPIHKIIFMCWVHKEYEVLSWKKKGRDRKSNWFVVSISLRYHMGLSLKKVPSKIACHTLHTFLWLPVNLL